MPGMKKHCTAARDREREREREGVSEEERAGKSAERIIVMK